MTLFTLICLFLFSHSIHSICPSGAPLHEFFVSVSVSSSPPRLLPIPSSSSSSPSAAAIPSNPNSFSFSCPSDCHFELVAFTAPHNRSVLHVRKDSAELVPAGHASSDSSLPITCAVSYNSCGATIPFYRHFSVYGSAIYHMYSIGEGRIDGYTREETPLCFLWSMTKGRQARQIPSPSSCYKQNPSDHLLDHLVEYVYNEGGAMTDHFYTTVAENSSELDGYRRVASLGKVLSKSDSSCGCLRALVQTFDHQSTSFFARRDHKLMGEEHELNRWLEKYSLTGERVFCVRSPGDCGASIPLYKHFDFVFIDSRLVTTSSPPPHSYPYPHEPLCYIWRSDYSTPLQQREQALSSIFFTTPEETSATDLAVENETATWSKAEEREEETTQSESVQEEKTENLEEEGTTEKVTTVAVTTKARSSTAAVGKRPLRDVLGSVLAALEGSSLAHISADVYQRIRNSLLAS